MIQTNIQKDYKKQLRRAHERMGAAVVAAATMIGVYAVSTEVRTAMNGLAVKPAFAVVKHNSKEVEPARHPMRLSDGLRAPATVGE